MYDKAFDMALELIKSFESCRLEAYPDPISPDGKPVTIGWGATGPGIQLGLRWTQYQADSRLLFDANKAFHVVLDSIHAPNTDFQIAALTSLTYNIGPEAFLTSQLLKYFNSGLYPAASDEFWKWNHSHGKVVDSLTRRRTEERAFFLGTVDKGQ